MKKDNHVKMTLTGLKGFYTSKRQLISLENFYRLNILKMFWYVRANQASFVKKRINKEIMKGSHLRNKF